MGSGTRDRLEEAHDTCDRHGRIPGQREHGSPLEPGCLRGPHVVDFPRGVRMNACLVPRRALGVRDDQLERVPATVIDADGSVATPSDRFS
ncbi:hypothetical protein ACFW1M_34745 [Streptomyces inhibens]|uniref:hypothetical protein n=1 Tax=Streptomyces inhibens TaxID=2293571 RepID=UPI00369CB5FF